MNTIPGITGLISDHNIWFALWRHSADLIRGAALARSREGEDSAWAAVIWSSDMGLTSIGHHRVAPCAPCPALSPMTDKSKESNVCPFYTNSDSSSLIWWNTTFGTNLSQLTICWQRNLLRSKQCVQQLNLCKLHWEWHLLWMKKISFKHAFVNDGYTTIMDNYCCNLNKDDNWQKTT